MKKPTISGKYLQDVYGSGEHFINCVYSGLFDVPLDDFYCVLGLDDVMTFGAGSYKIKKSTNHDSFVNFMESKNIYDIFKEINQTPINNYKNVFQWLNSIKKLKNSTDILKDKKLNPFRGQKNLEARLNLVNSESVKEFKQNLVKRTHRDSYPAPCNVYTELAKIINNYNQ